MDALQRTRYPVKALYLFILVFSTPAFAAPIVFDFTGTTSSLYSREVLFPVPDFDVESETVGGVGVGSQITGSISISNLEPRTISFSELGGSYSTTEGTGAEGGRRFPSLNDAGTRWGVGTTVRSTRFFSGDRTMQLGLFRSSAGDTVSLSVRHFRSRDGQYEEQVVSLSLTDPTGTAFDREGFDSSSYASALDFLRVLRMDDFTVSSGRFFYGSEGRNRLQIQRGTFSVDSFNLAMDVAEPGYLIAFAALMLLFPRRRLMAARGRKHARPSPDRTAAMEQITRIS